MSNSKPFSLAVIKGTNKGEVLRTSRKKISVGAGNDNDLVIEDPSISDRHFLVLIDQGRWRIHTFSPKNSITVDRRWSHPRSNKRGAIITAANTEILLFPGDLEQQIIDVEISKRGTGAFALPDSGNDLVSNIQNEPMEFESEELANEPTMAVSVHQMTNKKDPELVQISQMPTIAGERPPDDLRAAARERLQDHRGPSRAGGGRPVAPSVLRERTPDPLQNQPIRGLEQGEQNWDEKTVGVSWSSGRPQSKPIGSAPNRASWNQGHSPSKPREAHIPEVIAQPESQILSVPGGSKSVMSARPNFAQPSPSNAEVIELNAKPATPARGNRRTNAWGDGARPVAQDHALVPHDPAERSARQNAWGDASRNRAPEPPPQPKPSRGNAWGDSSRGSKAPAPQPRPHHPEESRPHEAAPRGRSSAGMVLSVKDILQDNNDVAIHLLKEPDGALATSIRLLGTKIEEYSRNLGYRAFLLTSAEPLTGKTTSVCNLAFALAEDTNRRVALIEANFRHPRIAQILGVKESIGTLPVVEGRAQLAESVVKLKDRNLVVLPTGGTHPHPAEVLASPRFKTMIAELANTVDVALIDAPSASPFADVNLLLPLVDGAFFVVAHKTTKGVWLTKALQQIGEKRVLGALFNNLPGETKKLLKKARKTRMQQK